MKKRILIFGPIGDFGGRELEAGFIANVLSAEYDVEICTSGSLTKKSQIFDFNENQKAFSLNDLLNKKYWSIFLLSYLSYLKNSKEGLVSMYANNNLAKKYFGYNKKIKFIIEELLPKYELVFICAQLSSNLINEVVSVAKQNKKKVLFRTTGTINNSNVDFIENVDLFIHHSIVNAGNLEKLKKHNYEVIDQCAFNEQDLLNVSLSRKGIHNFLILSRLSLEKGIEEIIELFLQVYSENDVLYIAGNGFLEDYLKSKYKESNCIKFIGFVNSSSLSDLFKSMDCLIIPSPEESGPLVGIEAMAAGKIIISTKVGAMPERLKDTLNQFWFDYNDLESFKNAFLSVKLLDEYQVNSIFSSLRNRYTQEYSINKIGKKYLNVVAKNLDKCE